MPYDLEEQHREKVNALRALHNGVNETGAATPALRMRLGHALAEARIAAGRYDAAAELARLLDRIPEGERIVELAGMLSLV